MSFGLLGVLALLLASCADEQFPAASILPTTTAPGENGDTAASILPTTTAPSENGDTSAPHDEDTISIDVAVRGTPLDHRLLGTNLPAWLGPERLEDPIFQAMTIESGATVLRMPGGSWSNSYNWLGCELRDGELCFWPQVARPTDFIDFLEATELDGMWTVSINHTAQSAGAAVAFFNGAADDERIIGVDRNGIDWGTVGSWARLRGAAGNAQPADIRLWEIGNEVYGGRPESGGVDCATFGWEDVWTCNGGDYAEGDDDHDGAVAIADAMRAVDPTIDVGFVGVGDPDSWGGWGNAVVGAGGDVMDFYAVHHYGFDSAPSGNQAIDAPADTWASLLDSARAVLPEDVEVAVTEYNLVAVEAGDSAATMTQAMNALYIADTIGQLAVNGVRIANQWNLANGTTLSGTDYGLIHADDLTPFPQFHAFSAWAEAGSTLLPPPELPKDGELRVYPTRRDDGSVVLIVLNMASEKTQQKFVFPGVGSNASATISSASSSDLSLMSMEISGPTDLGSVADPLTVTLPGWSINVLDVDG